MRRGLSITIKLTVALVLFAAVIIATMSVLAYSNERNSLREATFAELESRSIEKQAALDAWIARAEARAVALAASPAFDDVVAAALANTAAGDPAHTRAGLDRVRAELQIAGADGREYSGWLILDPVTARVVVSTDPDEEGTYREDQPFFIKGRTGAFVQNAYYSPSTQTTRITVAAPILGAGGTPLGVLAGHLDITEMNRIIGRRTGLRRTDDAFVVNTSHLYVTQPRFISDPAVLLRTVQTEAVDRVLKGGTGRIAAPDYRGRPAFIVYRWMPERELGLIVKVDQAEALAPLAALRNRFVVAGLLVLLVTSALAYGLARTVTVPVMRLAADAREFGRGNLDHHIEVTSSDELGQLAATLARMAGDLRETVVSRDDLQAEMAERERAERELDHLFEVAPDMISIIGFDGRFKRLNPAWERALGYTLDELDDQPFMDYVYDDDREATTAEADRLAAGASTLRFENRYVHKDGAVRWFSWAVKPAVDQRLFYCVTRDITDERQAADALRESERLLRQAEKVGRMGHWSMDLATGVMTWSDELLRIFGIEGDSGVEFDLDDMLRLMHPDDRERFVLTLGAIGESGEAGYEHRLLRSDGSVYHVTGRAILVRTDGNEPVAVYGTALDTTEIKQKERELEERNAELARFTYTASHDLKSPLVTIQSFLGYLEADMRLGDEERVQTDLTYMRTATDRMSQLLDELLELSRVGRRVNPPTHVSLQTVVNEAAGLVAGRIADRGVKVVITDRPVVLWGDRTRLVEVFQNLLDNAVKFMGGQPEPLIRVGAETDDGETVFFVQDNGAGVDERYQAKLFDLFEKLDPQTEGTGIGLALVERIVNIHGGRIWVESEGEGHGTTFRFTLSPRTKGEPTEITGLEARE